MSSVARCCCISPPRPGVVFIILNRLPSPLGMERREQEKKKTCSFGIRSGNSVGTWSGLFAQCMRVCLWMFECNFAWLFRPLATRPSANCLLSCKTKAWQAGKLASRSGILVELKCPRPKMSIYVIWKTKLTTAQTWRGWYALQKTLWKKKNLFDLLRHTDRHDSPQLLQRELQNAYKVNGKSLNVFGIQRLLWPNIRSRKKKHSSKIMNLLI